MAYMLLIQENGAFRRDRPLEDKRVAYQRMVRYGEDLKARGLYLASDSLASDAEGVRIEARAGKRVLIDGPFSEAKEIVGGFFLIDCATREQAIAIASECPALEWATVEVREVSPCHDDVPY
ncbi:MAG: YciI family protein [Panacagrimonas sp.]